MATVRTTFEASPDKNDMGESCIFILLASAV